jgi:Arm DNA-binding domain
MLAQPALPTFITFAAVRRKTPLPGKKRVCKRVSFATSPRRFMALADIRIRQARAASKPIKLADSNGLCIEVKPNGSKLWRYRYRIAGKENVFAIGEYPKVSLHAARLGRDTRAHWSGKVRIRRKHAAEKSPKPSRRRVKPSKPPLTNGSTRRRDSGRPATTLRYHA